eukprot:scaffold200626_cov33-Tisochrysis_lutea.AAC.2
MLPPQLSLGKAPPEVEGRYPYRPRWCCPQAVVQRPCQLTCVAESSGMYPSAAHFLTKHFGPRGIALPAVG